MKNAYLLFLLLILFNGGVFNLAYSQWSFIGSPETGHPIHFSYSSDRLYMAAQGGLFFSVDQGNHWSNIPLPVEIVAFNEVHEENGHLYLLYHYDWTDFSEILSQAYRSDDNGLTWKTIYTFPDLAFAELPPLFLQDTIILVRDNLLYVSLDAGNSFTSMDFTLGNADRIFFHHHHLMATDYESLYVSEDLGATWNTLYTSPDSLSSLRVSSIGSTLYKSEFFNDIPNSFDIYTVVSASIDNGVHWELKGIVDDPFFGNESILGDDQDLFLSENSYERLYHSKDGGISWSPTAENSDLVKYQYLKGLLLGSNDHNTSNHVRISTDQGITFHNHDQGLYAADCIDLLKSGNRLLVDANAGMFENKNGNQWPVLPNTENLVAADDLHAIAYVNGALKRSEDGGQQWITIPYTLFNENNYKYFGKLFSAGGMYFLNLNVGSWFSLDFGETWKELTTIDNESITAIAYEDPLVIISGDLGGVWQTSSGTEWEDITYDIWAPGVNSISMLYRFNGYTFAHVGGGSQRTTPGSSSWEWYTIDDPNQNIPLTPVEINSMAHFGNALLGAIYGHGVFLSLDNGDSWKPFNFGLNNLQAQCIRIFGEDIYLGVNGGIWKRPVSDLNLNAFSGIVFNDKNSNGLKESTEEGLDHILITKHREDNTISTLSDGTFTIYSENNLLDTISAAITSSYAQITTPPLYVTLPETGLSVGVHYLPGIYDGGVVLTNATRFRPGFTNLIKVAYTNEGTEPVGMNIQLDLPDELTYISASIAPDFNGDTLSWDIANVAPGESKDISVTVSVPASLPVGTLISVYGKVILNGQQDQNFADNQVYLEDKVVASCDPNDKNVEPTGNLTPQMIADSTKLIYTIRFQNTGNYPASFITIRDTLSSNLDIASLKILSTSHPFTWKFLPHNVLEFLFQNINLPDSMANELESRGFVKYSIRPKTSLRIADQVTNTANIIFDYNIPVVTNTVKSTISLESSVRDSQSLLSAKVSPSPCKDIVNIEIEDSNIRYPVTAQLFDANGQLARQMTIYGTSRFEMDVHDMMPGIYFVQLASSTHHSTYRIVKL